jgi:Protochlamydia outer membrane protein
MTKMLHQLTFLLALFFSVEICANCYPSVEIQAGWRRDNIDWKVRHVGSSYVDAMAKSHIEFKDMESYTVSGKARFIDPSYYIRLSADYGLGFKGRGKEHFKLYSSLFDCSEVGVHTNNPAKNGNEVYDFNGAIGYPYSFCCNRLSVIPLLGFSYHRQHLRIKQPGLGHSHSSYPTGGSCLTSEEIAAGETSNGYRSFWSHDSYFFPESSSNSSNPFKSSQSVNPFANYDSSHQTIAHALGLRNYRRTQNYRFTWYGFYAGFDLAYALDSNWTLFGELEGHFANRCHSKRKSWTGVYFVDHYHNQSWSYGFNGVVGATCALPNEWYFVVTTNYKWHQAHSHHHNDSIYWRSAEVQAGLGYMF